MSALLPLDVLPRSIRAASRFLAAQVRCYGSGSKIGMQGMMVEHRMDEAAYKRPFDGLSFGTDTYSQIP